MNYTVFSKIPYVKNVKMIQHKAVFTLIELIIVVSIIGIISALAIPVLSKIRDKAKLKNESKFKEENKQSKSDFKVPEGQDPNFEKIIYNLTLSSSTQRIGMDVNSSFRLNCEGSLRFSYLASASNELRLFIPFPKGTTEAMDVELEMTQNGQFLSLKDLKFTQNGIIWSGSLKDKSPIDANIQFTAIGRDDFILKLPLAGQRKNISINMDCQQLSKGIIPDHGLQASENDHPGFLQWQYKSLISNRPIIIEIPAAESALGKVVLLSKMTAIAVFIFGFGFWYMGDLKEVGLLKNFRLGRFFLLALTFSMFIIIFSVLSISGNLDPRLSMGVASLFSLPLLVFHASRIVSFSFAIKWILPLATFALSIVINAAYGDTFKHYIFLIHGIIALAFISLTYGKWFEGRKSYKLKLTKDLSDKNTKLNELMLENKNLFEDLKQLNSEFLNCMKFKPDTELKSEKTALRQFSIKLKELIREHKNIPDWTPHLDEFDLEASFQSHVDQYQKLKEETQRLCNNLSSEIDIFKKKTESIVVADMNIEEVKHRHCLHCGNEVYESTFCSSCGKHTSEIKTCDSCKKETILAQFNQYVNRPQKTCCYHCGVPHKEEAIPIS